MRSAAWLAQAGFEGFGPVEFRTPSAHELATTFALAHCFVPDVPHLLGDEEPMLPGLDQAMSIPTGRVPLMGALGRCPKP